MCNSTADTREAVLSPRISRGRLSFEYLVTAEDLDADGLSVSRSALTLNGGSIESIVGAPAVLDLDSHAFKRNSKHKVNGRVATAPEVSRVWISSRPSNGTAYGAGERIEVEVGFDLRIKVTGIPRLELTVGDRTRQARCWVRVSSMFFGAESLLFQYRVRPEDAAPGGISIAADALSLNGGSIRSMAAAPAVLDLNSHALKRDPKHRVDGSILTAPRVSGVRITSSPSNGAVYGAGEEIEVKVDLTMSVKVTGSPQLKLKVGDRTRQARYSVRWGGSYLFFKYWVQPEDAAPGGIAIAADALSLDGGSIRSMAAAPAVLDLNSHALKRDTKHKVDGSILTAPRVSGVRIASRPSNGMTYGAGEEMKVWVDFTMPVEVSRIPLLALDVGSRARQASFKRRIGDDTLYFLYRVGVEDVAPQGIAIAADALSLNGGSIRSMAAAPAVLDLNSHALKRDTKHRVDGSILTAPRVSGARIASRPSNRTAYGAGEGTKVRVDFNVRLMVTGRPQLELEVGNQTRQARYSASSVSGYCLYFRYIVQAEDAAPGGIAIAADELTLNGGSIRSVAAARAVLDLGSHAFKRDSKHKVDGSILTAPRVSHVSASSRPSNGTAYGAGEEIKVRVGFDMPLNVTGSPQLELKVGDRTRRARFSVSSVSGSSLFFGYRVRAKDAAPEGIAIAVDALTLNGGRIRSIVGAAATLDLGKHAIGHNPRHTVDGRIVTVPRVRQVGVSSRPSNRTAYGAGEGIEVWVRFDLPIKVTGSPQLELKVDDRTRQARYSVSSVGGCSLFFRYQVQAEDAAPGGIAIAPDALSLNGGTIRSMAAAPAVLDLGTHAFKRDSKHKVDGSTDRR